MSNSSRFNMLVNSASMNDDKAAMLDAYYEYQDTACLHPNSVNVVDAHTQTLRTIDVPCGRCWHCQQSKINEWCTRMYAHAEDFKHVYFVTLTYRSITDPDNVCNSLLLEKLGQAIWHRDAFNSTHHFCYRPCLLVKSHYQNFLKRLRKNTGLSDISYVCSGEYGHEYGAPHFHFILFTNGILTKQDIVRAWSVCLWRSNDGHWSYRKNQKYNGTAYDFPIGRIDFNDLVSNGTFNTMAKIRVDGTYMNAANCFSYVCKYVVKREEANLRRIYLAFSNLYHKERVVAIGDDECQFYQIRRYLTLSGFSFNTQTIDKLKSLSYEKSIFEPTPAISKHGILRTKRVTKSNFSYDVTLLPEEYYEFRDKFRPFCEFSRGTPIGSVYAKRNIQEFTQGIFTKPLLQSSGFVVPNYFRTKAKQYVYGLRKLRKTVKGQSLVLSGLIDLQGRLYQARENPASLSENMGDSMPYSYIQEALHDDRRLFIDAYTKERIIIYNDYAQHYKYNRHTRTFDLTRAIPIADWIRTQIRNLQFELSRHLSDVSRSIKSHAESERAFLIMTDYGLESSGLTNLYDIRQQSIRSEMSKLYHDSHLSVE